MTRSPDAPLRIVTLNILNDLTAWDQRGPLIVAGLRALDPDVIALQEVSLPFDSATWIAERLAGYQVLLAPYSGRRGASEALAILTRLPVEASDRLEFGHQGRVAQKAVLRHADMTWTVANAHLHHSLYDDRIRRTQALRLVDWLPRAAAVVVCGDFNALPHYRAIGHMRARFVCAHSAHHGAPRPTFPTALDRGPGARHRLRSAGLRAMGLTQRPRLEPWRGTLDYIFVDPSVTVLTCRRALDAPADHDPRLYPSDHMALVAELRAELKRAGDGA
jgi:endonuclease/exonuclease/phosphatase family metal-dependent hydrolase